MTVLEDDLISVEMNDDERDEVLGADSGDLAGYDQAFIDNLVEKILLFVLQFSGVQMYPYQQAFARRIILSLVTNDGDELTGLFSRQSGKSETLANTLSGCMVLLPKLAKMFPSLLGKFKNGLWVGVFAPVADQAETLYGRLVDRMTSDLALDIMSDSEIDDAAVGHGRIMRLKKSGSFCRMQTANPRASIESKSYHLVVIDEAQGADEYTVRKSIHPMLAHYNGTIVKIGTPDTKKGDFYKAIQLNKRIQSKGRKQNHYEFNWKFCAKYNPNYAKFVKKEMERLGEDSDEFQLSYNLKWLLERGMFVTESVMEELGDKSMEIVRAWNRTPVVVGIDPARKKDSTVITVVWVDWEKPDEFGFFDHRILNWLEIHGDDWEEQYFKIVDFLSAYNVIAIGVDAQGVGDAVAQRLAILFPGTQVEPLDSTVPAQSARWKHLMQLIQRKQIGWPAHAKTRRLKTWRRFHQQMIDLEKKYQGPHLLAEAPNEAEAHDDYCDSLAIACVMTKDLTMPTVEVTTGTFYASRRG